MIKSMTAFGRAKREGEDKDITIEIKSVNSRYFDLIGRVEIKGRLLQVLKLMGALAWISKSIKKT